MRSLNECLSRVPLILENMCALLLRFRTKKIGIIPDIEKAFLQVGLQEHNQNVARFLWIKDTKSCRVNRLPRRCNKTLHRIKTNFSECVNEFTRIDIKLTKTK